MFISLSFNSSKLIINEIVISSGEFQENNVSIRETSQQIHIVINKSAGLL